jgi:hypothetical protein
MGDFQLFNKTLTESATGAGNPELFYDFRFQNDYQQFYNADNAYELLNITTNEIYVY